ncbi:mastermind-like protein 2 [Latimeria chalumnae]|uniref:mastermind-like protein 2 n=1 Tax=Latimeria chalumnae TaxID=7897 RepID=UPI0003C13C34
MGDAAPPQPTTGTGVLGSVMGVGGPALTGAGGSAAPRLHSAIVERLRARIEYYRQQHAHSQGRYERTRAESSERERESTLQLLNIMQHGQSGRKNKQHKSAQPPDYNTGGGGGSNSNSNSNSSQQQQQQQQQHCDRINGEQLQSSAEQRNSTRIALDILPGVLCSKSHEKASWQRAFEKLSYLSLTTHVLVWTSKNNLLRSK